MSLVNAVHVLLEVAAGRRNLNPADADELHAAIDAEQNPPQVPDPIPASTSAESEIRQFGRPSTTEGTLTVGS